MRNLEFKARLEDPKGAMSRAHSLGAELWGDLRQTDTYYAVPGGRLKLRETPGYPAALIFYQRDEAAAVRFSDYETAHSPEGAALRELLSHALGVLAVVRKRRTFLLLDTTRLHFDNVEGLGDFYEIEVPVKEGEEAPAKQRFESVLSGMGFTAADSIRASYLDLILASQEKPGG